MVMPRRREILHTDEDLKALFCEDLYHTFLDTKFSYQILCFIGTYLVMFLVYAVLYVAIDKPCGLQLEGDFARAYMLAMETMTTIGYGVPDPYMQGCWQGAMVITSQCLLNLLLTALLIGLIFQGISRPQSRASTILFSDKATINSINGVHYLQFRICDLRIQHALIEPHVRCYCVQ